MANGINISSDNKVSVKPGTNVTVNANGVSVTGNGSVADGDTGLINGDKLYDEVRSSANGNYVSSNNTTAQNLKALDNALSDGNADLNANSITTKNDGTIGRNLTVNGTTTLKDLIATGDTSLQNICRTSFKAGCKSWLFQIYARSTRSCERKANNANE